MAVSSEVSRTDYVGNGTVDAYSTTFPVKSTSEVRVFTQDADGQDVELTLGADFSAVVSTSGLCTITLTAGDLANGYKLSIQRGIPFTQTYSPAQSGAYNAVSLGIALDRLCMEVVRIKGDLARAIKIPYLEAGGDAVTKLDDNAANRAGKGLAFDNDGNAYAGAPLASASASAYMLTLLDDTTADAARTTLGLPSQAMAARTVVANDTAGTANGTATPIDGLTVLADGSTARRDLSARAADVVNVMDFTGVDPTGVADSTAGIDAAFALAQSTQYSISVTESGAQGFVTSNAKRKVFFPSGKYRITASVGNGANDVIVSGERAYLYSTDRTIALLSLGTFNVVVEGMIFDGGAYHIKFGGSRIESGHMAIRDCQFRNAKKRCIFMDRLTDIPGVSGWPANLRIHDCKSYGSGFLEAYCNGVTIADCWLAWDVSATYWDGGALIIANDNVRCYNIAEIPFNTNSALYPRFQDATGVLAAEDFLSVSCYGCRFGGEATKTAIAHFRTKGSGLLLDGCSVFGVADGYWLQCDAIPERVTVRDCFGGVTTGFVNSWGMWFNSSLGISDIPAQCRFDLDLSTAYASAFRAASSADKTVQTGSSFSLVPKQAALGSSPRLRNYDVGDSFAFWGAPYTTDASLAAFSGGVTLLGAGGAGQITFSGLGYFATRFPGFNPAVAGPVTFSCWVNCSSRSEWYFYPDNGTPVMAGSGILEKGINRVVVTFYHAGSGATIPALGFTGKNTDTIDFGFFNFNLGDVAGEWQPAGSTQGQATGSFYGQATYDPANLVDGAGVTTTVTVTGAALGDLVRHSFSLDLQGITMTSYVSAANTVAVRFQNESGGAIDLGSGTIRCRVEKP